MAGMVTCSVEHEVGKIGLIAVAEKYQGQGWGKKLVKAAEYKCYQAGAKEMLIPTQETNLPACKLYQSLGYTSAQRGHVYHWWKS
ncbi:peptide alpha-N-acetyltransferase [Algoriphagus yeomjeoni]|uniref:Peptide alpha-N-acetyltransferase n=2 Tax=Algoriphagus yeomjeoni TaxID=291403 RepID=A0A327NZY3_9BACT|nr:peptide alpha-N-acetyltransferase [Algoriphagus yeomjeoni]